MSRGDLRAEISTCLGSFLETQGFREIHYLYSEQSFGNEILDLTDGCFTIRFVRDRSLIGIEMKRNGGDWQGIAFLLARLGIADPAAGLPVDFDEPPSNGFPFGAEHLVSEWPRLAGLLRDA